MKIRTGFVSNSSSSSYVIYGVYISEKDLQDFIDITVASDNFFRHVRTYYPDYALVNQLNKEIAEDIFYEYASELGFIFPGEDKDGAYLGFCWSEVKDNETGAEFKERTRQFVEKTLGSPQRCFTHDFTVYS